MIKRLFSVKRASSDPFRQLFNDLLAPFEPAMQPAAALSPRLSLFDAVSRVRADVHETDAEYLIEAEVPGVSRDSIKIDLHDSDRTLTITGTQNKEATTSPDSKDKKRTWFSERLSGEFRRVFAFGEQIKGDRVKAELRDGVLRVCVPKERPSEASASRKIEIE